MPVSRIAIPADDASADAYGVRPNAHFKGFLPGGRGAALRDAVVSVWRELAYSCHGAAARLMGGGAARRHATLAALPSASHGLVVLLHGLNGHPSCWNKHIKLFEKHGRIGGCPLDLFAPPLPKKGHCSTEGKAFDALCRQIEGWCAANPNKPLVLQGQSRGSCFAAAIEVRLRASCPDTPVSLSLTGPVLHGTGAVDRLRRLLPDRWLTALSGGLLSKRALEDLSSGSAAAQKLLAAVRAPLPDGVAPRRYRLYAPRYDSHVWEKGSALPLLGDGATTDQKCYLAPRYGHNSIVSAFAEEQVAKAIHWVRRQSDDADGKERCYHCLRASGDGGGRLLAYRDGRPLWQRVAHAAVWPLKQAPVLLQRWRHELVDAAQRAAFLRPERQDDGSYTYPADRLPWHDADSSGGLNLMVAGLRGNPFHWSSYAAALRRSHSGYHSVVPVVPLDGNCSLEVALPPLLELVEDYLRRFPGQPLNFFGTSNGARLILALASRIDPDLLGDTPLNIVSIAGVHYGTKLIDRLDESGVLALAGLDEALADEFHWGSAKAQELLEEWRERQELWQQRGCRVRHLFVASTEDECVGVRAAMPLDPTGSASTAYKVLHGETHISVVEAALPDVMAWCQPEEQG